MEIFDERPGFVYLEDIEYSTLINEAESGKEKRRNKWPSGCAISGDTRAIFESEDAEIRKAVSVLVPSPQGRG